MCVCVCVVGSLVHQAGGQHLCVCESEGAEAEPGRVPGRWWTEGGAAGPALHTRGLGSLWRVIYSRLAGRKNPLLLHLREGGPATWVVGLRRSQPPVRETQHAQPGLGALGTKYLVLARAQRKVVGMHRGCGGSPRTAVSSRTM